jgi:alginate O-acetyltransferase complex protein AlgI
VAAVDYSTAIVFDRARARRQQEVLSHALLVMIAAGNIALFVVLKLAGSWGAGGAWLAANRALAPGATRALIPLGLGVLTCHAVAYLVDVRRGEATNRPLTTALYLLQFPVLLAGPIVRYRDFSAELSRRVVGVGAFAYGVRRFVTGLIKLVLIADTLAGPADQIFQLPASRLSADTAWLGAAAWSLQIYFQFSGYSDLAIGLGRMFGLRYPENFRRPYTADSIREFWRRWNITLITWLRDYLSLPIVGQDRPTVRLYVNLVAGFCLVGLWHGAGRNVLVWAVYFGTLLALEAIGLGAKMERWPATIRHAYVLVAVTIGWVILRAETVSGARMFLKAMAGLSGPSALTAHTYFTAPLLLALGTAAVGAGPLVRQISRWRVFLDAATTSAVMMVAATGIFIWRASRVVHLVRGVLGDGR